MSGRATAAMALLLLISGGVVVRAGEPGTVRVAPAAVDIGLFYGGQTIDVRAAAPAGCGVVFKISGRREDLRLKVKGKRGGFIWMSVGELTYPAVPSLFMIKSDRPLDELAPKRALQKLGIGYDSLRAELLKDGDDGAGAHFDELIELKEHEELFSVEAGGMDLSDKTAGSPAAHASFFLPPKAPVGEYAVEVFGFKDGEGFRIGSGSVTLGYAGATAFIVSLAHDHGLLYGCLAVLISILAGLLIGLIFRGKAGAH